MRALDAGVVPVERLLGRRREHDEQARRVGAVAVDQVLRIDAVALGLAHLQHAAVFDCVPSARRPERARATAARTGLLPPRFAPLPPRGRGRPRWGRFVDRGDVVGREVVDAALRRRARPDVVEDHALGQQLGERLVDLDQLHVAHHLGPEARVEQVQDRVLDAADVLVHRHPVLRSGADHRVVELRVAIAHEVPGAVDEGVHRVGFAARRAAAGRAGDVQERAVLGERVARAVGDQVFGQDDRQVLLGHRDDAARLAVDDRDRRAPVALPADAPVAQAPGHLLAAQAAVLERRRDRVDRDLVRQAAVVVGVDRDAAGRCRRTSPASARTRTPRRRRGRPGACRCRTAARTRSRARRAPGRPSPRRRRSGSGRSCRPRAGSARG